jgi:zinc transporter 9
VAAGSKLAVGAAIGGNTVVAIAKFIAFGFTGSGAMLSEAIHSVADVLNQVLLMVGVVRSDREPDEKHPYGYGRERFVWALMSAVGIFFLGCGVTVYHGIHSLMHPTAIKSVTWAIAVLIFALVVEAIILVLALQQLKKQAGDEPIFQYLRSDADPATVAVVLEDAAACLGILIALACIGLAKVTGQAYWDAIGSLSIGFLLGGIAIFLIVRNHQLLVGQTVPLDVQEKVRAILEAEPAVEEVFELKGRMLDLETYDIMADIEFDGRHFAEEMEPQLREAWGKIENIDDFLEFTRQFADDVVEALGDEVDDLEQRIREKVPEAVHLDLEAH